MSHYHLQTEIDINADAECVWRILTDFDAYPEWNPFIRFIRGIPEKGAQLEIKVQPSNTKGMIFRPCVQVFDSENELRWLGHFLLPNIFDGEHRFIIQSIGDKKVRFQHSELFSGLLVPLFRNNLERDTQRGFNEMNNALKVRAETTALL